MKLPTKRLKPLKMPKADTLHGKWNENQVYLTKPSTEKSIL